MSRRFTYGSRKYGSMSEPDVKRLRQLEKENGRLKRLLAERDVEIDVTKEFLGKSSGGCIASCVGSSSRRSTRFPRDGPATSAVARTMPGSDSATNGWKSIVPRGDKIGG